MVFLQRSLALPVTSSDSILRLKRLYYTACDLPASSNAGTAAAETVGSPSTRHRQPSPTCIPCPTASHILLTNHNSTAQYLLLQCRPTAATKLHRRDSRALTTDSQAQSVHAARLPVHYSGLQALFWDQSECLLDPGQVHGQPAARRLLPSGLQMHVSGMSLP